MLAGVAAATRVVATVSTSGVGIGPIAKADFRSAISSRPATLSSIVSGNSRAAIISRATRAIPVTRCSVPVLIILPAAATESLVGAIVVPAARRIVVVAHALGCRTRTAATVTRTPVVAIAVTMPRRGIAVMHIPVVVDRNTRTPIVVTVVMVAVVRMSPVTRVINVQVAV